MTYDTSDPDAIERELAETRARLDVRLEQLERMLSPGRLVESGLDYLREGQGAEFVRNLGAEVRDNPLPVALTGIGLAWLMTASALSWNRNGADMADRDGGTASPLYDDMAARAQAAGDRLARLADETEEAFTTRVAEARARILGVQRDASETASAFIDRVQQAFDSAQQNARLQLEQLRETGREWSASVADQARRAGDAVGQSALQSREMVLWAGSAIANAVDQNPLLLGAFGLAAGVLLAPLLPVAEQEEALVAPVADAIRRASDEALDRGKRAAAAAAESAYHEIAKP